MEEGFRLAGSEETTQLRLSLLLFDSAVELLMHRQVEADLYWDRLRRAQLEHLSGLLDLTGSPPPKIQDIHSELQTSVLSRRRARDLERDFGAKARYLNEKGQLTGPVLQALLKLHQYRNETYHRDVVRLGSLRPAVRLYGYVACLVMQSLPPSSLTHGSSVPPVLQRVLGARNPRVGIGFGLQANVAQALLDQHWQEPLREVTGDLADHVVDRLDQMNEVLSFAAPFIRDAHPGQAWDEEAVLHFVQIEDERFAALGSAEQCRSYPVPAPIGALSDWRQRAEELRSADDVLAAFVQFAAVEDQMEPVETKCLELAAAIDGAIQDEVDRRRGK